jgi:hypothetical protein
MEWNNTQSNSGNLNCSFARCFSLQSPLGLLTLLGESRACLIAWSADAVTQMIWQLYPWKHANEIVWIVLKLNILET